MKLTEDRLTGWLCMIRFNFEGDCCPYVPAQVQEELMERGWLRIEKNREWDGKHCAKVTHAGIAVSDLAAPEWGIDPVGVVSD